MIPKAVTDRSSLVAGGVAGLTLLLVLWSPVVAQGDGGTSVRPPAGAPVTIEATDASLTELVRMLGRAADVKIVIGADVDKDKLISVNLPNVDVETALKAIVEAAGCYWDRRDDIYIITSEPPPMRVETSAPRPPEPQLVPEQTETAVVSPDPASPLDTTGAVEPRVAPTDDDVIKPRVPPSPSDFTIDTIPLKYANCVDLALMFGGTVPPTAQATFHQTTGRRGSNRGWQNAGGGWDTTGPGSWFGSVGTRGQALRDGFSQLGGGFGGGLGGLGGGFGGGGLGGLGGGFGGGRGGMGGGGFGGGGGFTALLPEEITAVTAFLDDNALIVRGTPEAIDEFREIVALLDKPVKQVEISVKFVSITTTFEEAFGIDWAIKNTRIEVFNQGFAPPQAINSVIRFATGNLDTQLNALEKSSRATVVQEPRVSVQNNAYAYVEFSTSIPVYTANVTYNQFGQRQVDFEQEDFEVENYLDVMPRVNADDSVSLYLMPNISNVVGWVEAPDGSRAPIITYQTVETMLRVQDGETVVIGGLITKDDSTTRLRTPLLSRIPILGKLFSSRTKALNDTELLIFVTPRILREVPTD